MNNKDTIIITTDNNKKNVQALRVRSSSMPRNKKNTLNSTLKSGSLIVKRQQQQQQTQQQHQQNNEKKAVRFADSLGLDLENTINLTKVFNLNVNMEHHSAVISANSAHFYHHNIITKLNKYGKLESDV
jgi:hypothetical protein